MDYKRFKEIFGDTIFGKSKFDLIKKIASSPERYIGLFRPTKPGAKIIQNLLQSHEIRFGDAFESLITEYLKQMKFTILDNKFVSSEGNTLELDQIFCKGNTIFFVEQKIRDDHDSTKKRGQIKNFEEKIKAVIKKYTGKNIIGFFYFIDDSFNKNKNFYMDEINKLSDNYKITLHLSYGRDFFSKIGAEQTWDEILKYLVAWKSDAPELPDINFDQYAEESFQEIQELDAQSYIKLFSNEGLDDVLRVLFPERKTLYRLAEYFATRSRNGEEKYSRAKKACDDALHRLRNS